MGRPTMTMLVGLPASGKSTYAKQLAEKTNAIVFGSDALREEMFGDVNDQSHNGELFNELHRRIKKCLKSGNNAIYDATNISSKRRAAFLSELKHIDCKKSCVIIATPYEQCLKNNKNRDKRVPEWVIERMYKKWQTPFWFEGWKSIKIHYWEDSEDSIDVNELLDSLIEYDQCNPHHTMTLASHLINAAGRFESCGYKDGYWCNNLNFGSTWLACLLHDMSKPKVQTFINSKGEETSVAHYYSHEHVSAYDSLFVNYIRAFANILRVSALITWHMQPYAWERDNNEKLHNKYRKIWGEEFYNCIMALHEADKKVH